MSVHKQSFCGTGNKTLRGLPVNYYHHVISSTIFMRQFTMVNKLFVESCVCRLSGRQELLVHFWINCRNKVQAEVR